MKQLEKKVNIKKKNTKPAETTEIFDILRSIADDNRGSRKALEEMVSFNTNKPILDKPEKINDSLKNYEPQRALNFSKKKNAKAIKGVKNSSTPLSGISEMMSLITTTLNDIAIILATALHQQLPSHEKELKPGKKYEDKLTNIAKTKKDNPTVSNQLIPLKSGKASKSQWDVLFKKLDNIAKMLVVINKGKASIPNSVYAELQKLIDALGNKRKAKTASDFLKILETSLTNISNSLIKSSDAFIAAARALKEMRNQIILYMLLASQPEFELALSKIDRIINITNEKEKNKINSNYAKAAKTGALGLTIAAIAFLIATVTKINDVNFELLWKLSAWIVVLFGSLLLLNRILSPKNQNGITASMNSNALAIAVLAASMGLLLLVLAHIGELSWKQIAVLVIFIGALSAVLFMVGGKGDNTKNVMKGSNNTSIRIKTKTVGDAMLAFAIGLGVLIAIIAVVATKTDANFWLTAFKLIAFVALISLAITLPSIILGVINKGSKSPAKSQSATSFTMSMLGFSIGIGILVLVIALVSKYADDSFWKNAFMLILFVALMGMTFGIIFGNGGEFPKSKKLGILGSIKKSVSISPVRMLLAVATIVSAIIGITIAIKYYKNNIGDNAFGTVFDFLVVTALLVWTMKFIVTGELPFGLTGTNGRFKKWKNTKPNWKNVLINVGLVAAIAIVLGAIVYGVTKTPPIQQLILPLMSIMAVTLVVFHIVKKLRDMKFTEKQLISFKQNLKVFTEIAAILVVIGLSLIPMQVLSLGTTLTAIVSMVAITGMALGVMEILKKINFTEKQIASFKEKLGIFALICGILIVIGLALIPMQSLDFATTQGIVLTMMEIAGMSIGLLYVLKNIKLNGSALINLLKAVGVIALIAAVFIGIGFGIMLIQDLDFVKSQKGMAALGLCLVEMIAAIAGVAVALSVPIVALFVIEGIAGLVMIMGAMLLSAFTVKQISEIQIKKGQIEQFNSSISILTKTISDLEIDRKEVRKARKLKRIMRNYKKIGKFITALSETHVNITNINNVAKAASAFIKEMDKIETPNRRHTRLIKVAFRNYRHISKVLSEIGSVKIDPTVIKAFSDSLSKFITTVTTGTSELTKNSNQQQGTMSQGVMAIMNMIGSYVNAIKSLSEGTYSTYGLDAEGKLVELSKDSIIKVKPGEQNSMAILAATKIVDMVKTLVIKLGELGKDEELLDGLEDILEIFSDEGEGVTSIMGVINTMVDCVVSMSQGYREIWSVNDKGELVMTSKVPIDWAKEGTQAATNIMTMFKCLVNQLNAYLPSALATVSNWKTPEKMSIFSQVMNPIFDIIGKMTSGEIGKVVTDTTKIDTILGNFYKLTDYIKTTIDDYQDDEKMSSLSHNKIIQFIVLFNRIDFPRINNGFTKFNYNVDKLIKLINGVNLDKAIELRNTLKELKANNFTREQMSNWNKIFDTLESYTRNVDKISSNIESVKKVAETTQSSVDAKLNHNMSKAKTTEEKLNIIANYIQQLIQKNEMEVTVKNVVTAQLSQNTINELS